MKPPAEMNPKRPAPRAIPTLLPMDGVPILERVRTVPFDPTNLPEALPVAEPVRPAPPKPDRLVRFLWAVLLTPEWLFGVAVLFIGLAVLAALPVLQFLSLGYLLEAGGRVARTGRLRDALIGVRLAARLGGVVLGAWLFLLPARFVADMAKAAEIINPGGRAATNWRIGLIVLIGLTFVHVATACARGGRLRYFCWPFNFVWLAFRFCRGGYYSEARDAVWDTVMALRLPYYFWLGFRGFVGAFAWLVLPISLLALSRGTSGLATLAGWMGAFLLAIVLMYLPFLQMRLAATNRLGAVFELGAVRSDFGRAPWAFAVSFVVTLLFALPLYLLKIEIVPSEAAWLPSLVFIVFIFPARLLTGWALSRAAKRQLPRHWFFRWTGRIPLVPAAFFYVLIVFFTQYTSWNGAWSLYEQHAFLVPVPFFGM
jgi:hypothetical protein